MANISGKWNSVVTFCKIDFFNNGNGNQIIFDNLNEQYSFFDNHKIASLQFEQSSYVRTNAGTLRFAINADKLKAMAPNWLFFQNLDFNTKRYYARVLSIDYINENLSEVRYATDNFQTYMFDLDLSKQTFIERRTFLSSEKNEIMDLPYENLDCGSQYITLDTIYDMNDTNEDYKTGQFYFMITTSKLYDGANRYIETSTKTKSYMKSNVVQSYSTKNGIPQNTYGYVLNHKALSKMIDTNLLSQDCDIINSIQLIVMLPYGRSLFPENLTNHATQIKTSTSPSWGSENMDSGCEVYDQSSFGTLNKTFTIDKWCSYLNDYINKCIDKNTDFSKIDNETLTTSAIGLYLYRYPYSLLEVNNFNDRVTIQLNKLDYTNHFKAMTDMSLTINKWASIGQTPELVHQIGFYGINSYYTNMRNLMGNSNDLYEITSDNLISLTSSNQVAIINDYLATYMQANQNQINANKSNALSINQTAYANAQLAKDMAYRSAEANKESSNLSALTNQSIAMNNLDLTMRQANISNRANLYSALNNATSFAGNTLSLAAVPSVSAGIGMANSAVNFASSLDMYTSQNRLNDLTKSMQTDNINAAYNTSIVNAQRAQDISNAQADAAYQATINTANNVYENTIKSVNAQITDLSNVPDTVQNMGNWNSIFNIMNDRNSIKYSTKSLPYPVMQQLINYFVLYGFFTNKMETLQEVFRKHKNSPGFYIKTVNANIAGDIPQDALTDLKTNLDSGIMIWKAKDYLDYDKIRSL